MNGAHFHLLVNHLPIVGSMIGSAVLAGGLIYKSAPVKRVALIILIFSGITAMLANLSGEDAEQLVEDIQGVSHRQIHEHEESGEKFFMLSGLIGILSIVTFLLDLKDKPAKKYLYISLVVLCALNLFLGTKTGLTGGEIRHSEINSSPAVGDTEAEEDERK